jgi:cohesin complex subunit SCC1
MDDDDEDEHGESGTKRRAETIHDGEDANANANANANTQQQPPRRKRRRKRRKVVIDNHDTELTTEHIRSMLSNADDIVAPMPHPASLWDDRNTNSSSNAAATEPSKDYRTLVEEDRRKRELEESGTGHKRSVLRGDPSVPILTQPFLADPGTQGRGQAQLNPLLRQLWKDNYWKALGQPCPYKRLDDDKNNDNDAADDVETVRRDASNANTDETSTVGSDLNIANDGGDDDNNKNATTTTTDGIGEQDDGFEFPPAIDDEEEEEEIDTPIPDFGDDEDNAALRKGTAGDNDDDLLDLGMVNDMILDSDEEETNDDDAEEEDDRQTTAGSSTKWHKHTVRVFSHLKKCLDNDNNNDNNDNDNSMVDFHELTKHMVSRRNASSVFFEMLQLKTWDFIELDQDEPYGTISVSKGARFSEDVPKD